MQLSILDQMATPVGKSAEEIAEETIKNVQLAEKLGYKRYWFAEHHGTRGMGSSSPEIMMATAASRTTSIHVGSGGILLPQYSAFKVATQLLQLQTLFPGRIDGGVGRSPGGIERIRSALADDKENQLAAYPQKLEALTRFVNGQEVNGVRATPRTKEAPALYSLGLGENSARLAADLGIGYVYGHFINPSRGVAAHQVYRENFSPSLLNRPTAFTAIFVICGKSDAHAEELALSQDLWLLRTENGLDSRVPSMEEAKTVKLTEKDRHTITENRKRMIVGGPQTVKDTLLRLAERYENEEWMVLTNIYDFKEKQHSFGRLAELFL